MAFAQNISYSHCFPSTPSVNPNPATAIIPSQTSPQSPTSASTLRSSPSLSTSAVITNGPPLGPVPGPVTGCEVSGPQIASLFPHFSDATPNATPSLYATPYRNPQSAYFPFGPTPPEPGSLYHPLNSTAPYALPDNRGTPGYGWRAPSLPQPPCPYDPTAYPHPYQYPAGGYASSLDSSRRKNATRESTATLKAWLQEHIQNPYPTKGEKIMLAIITKMTLTQVSTWFANARRRLKKENKMTWSPKVKVDQDDDDKSSDQCKDDEDEDDLEKGKNYHLSIPLEREPAVDSDYTPACVPDDYSASLSVVGSG